MASTFSDTMPTVALDIDEIRSNFPLLQPPAGKSLVYLDNASSSLKPAAMIHRLVADSPVPIVLDADGLNAFPGGAGIAERHSPDVPVRVAVVDRHTVPATCATRDRSSLRGWAVNNHGPSRAILSVHYGRIPGSLALCPYRRRCAPRGPHRATTSPRTSGWVDRLRPPGAR